MVMSLPRRLYKHKLHLISCIDLNITFLLEALCVLIYSEKNEKTSNCAASTGCVGVLSRGVALFTNTHQLKEKL